MNNATSAELRQLAANCGFNIGRGGICASRMIVAVLGRQANQDTGERRMAFAVIRQAVDDAFVISKNGIPTKDGKAPSRRSIEEVEQLIKFLASGCDPWATFIGLDPDYVVHIVNRKFVGDSFGLIDKVRMRLHISAEAA